MLPICRDGLWDAISNVFTRNKFHIVSRRASDQKTIAPRFATSKQRFLGHKIHQVVDVHDIATSRRLRRSTSPSY